MSTYLEDLLDLEKLSVDISDGYISVSAHPTLPLDIYCYTHKAQYDRHWTNEVCVCRGLIVEQGTNLVVARGPKKFFNYGQSDAPEISPNALCVVTDKMDGSLGILYTYEGHTAIATKGSFVSEQALKGTEMYYEGKFSDTSRTKIFEIIYPSNRIVVSYGDLEYLEFLGHVDNETGIIDRSESDVILYDQIPFKDVLLLPDRKNAEGFVVDLIGYSGKAYAHVKIKQEDYIRLHAIITNTSAKNLWVYLVAEQFRDKNFTEKQWGSIFKHDGAQLESAAKEPNWRDILFDTVPDEFEQWVHETLKDFDKNFCVLYAEANSLAYVNKDLSGRELYETLKDNKFVNSIINLIKTGDDSKLIQNIWASLKPVGNTRPFKDNDE